MQSSFRTAVHEESQVGEARRAIKELCTRLGGNATFSGRASLIGTELARNLVLHGGGGEIVFRELANAQQAGLEILALDRGSGMRNVAECLRDGYSTAGTPGTGLGAVRRLADIFELSTTEGRGTAICTRLFQRPEQIEKSPRRVGAVSVALQGEEFCGDSWAVLENTNGLRILVADGLGHGAFAADASREAVAVFRAHPHRPVGEVLQFVHQALIKTRGAAAAIAEIHVAGRKVTMAGAGNISVRIFDGEGRSRQMASANGTLGAALPRIQEFTTPWTADSLLFLHSDGLSADWQPDVYPGLLARHPAVIAGVLYRDFARVRDDATVVVASCPQ